MKRYTKVFLTTILGLLFFVGICFAFDDGDFQIWNTDGIEVKLNQKLKMTAEEEMRFGGNVSEIYYAHSDAGLVLNVTEGLDFGVNYRYISEKDSKNEWKEEHCPHFNAVVSWKWHEFAFSNRSRMEFRIKEKPGDEWRYRDLFKIKAPVKWTKYEIRPYIADEFYVDFYGDKINTNRLYAGFEFKLHKNLKGDIFYLWQSKKTSDDWLDYNVLGLTAKYVF